VPAPEPAPSPTPPTTPAADEPTPEPAPTPDEDKSSEPTPKLTPRQQRERDLREKQRHEREAKEARERAARLEQIEKERARAEAERDRARIEAEREKSRLEAEKVASEKARLEAERKRLELEKAQLENAKNEPPPLLNTPPKPVQPAGSPEVLVVLINPSAGGSSLSRDEIRNIYFGRTNIWPNGRATRAFNRPASSAAGRKFFGIVLRTSSASFREHWSSLQMSGSGIAPSTIGSAESMIARVAGTAGAIGYVLESELPADLKGLRIIRLR
jgi:hypothetical protein